MESYGTGSMRELNRMEMVIIMVMFIKSFVQHPLIILSNVKTSPPKKTVFQHEVERVKGCD